MAIKLSDIIGVSTTVPDSPVILDDISASFNGVKTAFTLTTNNGTTFSSVELDTEARLIVSVGGIVQQPSPGLSGGFYLSGSSVRLINFVEAPLLGQTFFGIALKSTNTAVTPLASQETAIAYSIALG